MVAMVAKLAGLSRLLIAMWSVFVFHLELHLV